MKNIITFLLVVIFPCYVFAQSTLVGTWETEDGGKLEINELLVGYYTKTGLKLQLTANELPNASSKSTAISMSMKSAINLTGTMTGQIYEDGGNTRLEVFYVLENGNDIAGSAETLFFKKTSSVIPLLNFTPVSNTNFPDLIGPWLDGSGIVGLNIVYVKDTQAYATFSYVPVGYNTSVLIKLKGFISQIASGYSFSLSGISPLFKDDKNEPFTMSLAGVIKPNSNQLKLSASMNLAHALGKGFSYSVVRSEGAYFTKATQGRFAYKTAENVLEQINFTNNGASNWVAPIKIGLNQSLKMALDTGGNFDWVNSTQCRSTVCTIGHTQYNPLNSNTFGWIDQNPKQKDWGPWGTTMANLGHDIVNVQPTTLTTGFFKGINLITKFDETDQFREMLWDGALAVPSYSSGGNPYDIKQAIDNIIIDLVASGTIDPSKVNVSFSYDKSTGLGKYTIGMDSVDSNLIDLNSKITLAQNDYKPVPYLWTASLKSVKVGDTEVSGINPAVTRFAFDTGASALKGDTTKMNEVLGYIGNNGPNIEYTMGVDKDGKDGKIVLTSQQYRRTIDQGQNVGTQQVQVQPLDGLPNLWLQGSTLMEDLYTVFKYNVSFNAKGDLILNAREVNLYNKINGPQTIKKQFCEEIFVDKGGLSTSHSNNENYTVNYLPTTPKEKVRLSFEYIDLENNYDFLEIYDGPVATASQIIGRYTGLHNNVRITSTHDSGALTVKFISDHSITNRGWSATVNKCIEVRPDCDEAFTDSGRANGNYRDNERKTTNFVALKGKQVQIRFDFIDLERNYDFLEIYDGLDASSSRRIERITGNMSNVVITSTQGALTVVFTSDSSVTRRGWNATVDKCVEVTYNCVEAFTDSGKAIGNYSNNERQTTNFVAIPGKQVQIRFDFIDLERNYDFLEIYDGLDASSSRRIERITGNMSNVVITSTRGALTVVFTSDSSVILRGWNATVDKCVEVPFKCVEVFTDSGRANGNYRDNERETTNFVAIPGEQVHIRFDFIDLERNYDFLEIYDGPDASSSRRIQRITGDRSNLVITSTQGALTVVFTSDSSVTRRGWNATVNKCASIVPVEVGAMNARSESDMVGKKEQKEQEINIWNDVLMFPNPVTSSFQIVIPSSENIVGDAKILITDSLGKVVGNYIYKDKATSLEIDISRFSVGVYYVQISNLERKTVKKIIKQ
jgi:hypothetical protein